MAEYSYLQARKTAGARGRARALMSAKRNYPFAWLLAFAATDRVAGSPGVLASRTADAIARAARRFERLRPLSGPKLTATFDGFVAFLRGVREPWLVLDATELAHAGSSELDDLLETAATLDDLAHDPRSLDLEEWDIAQSAERDDSDDDDDDDSDDDDDDDSDDDANAHFEIDGSGSEATYRMFGAVENGDSSWLRPPETDDSARVAAVLAAMRDYKRLTGPITTEDDVRLTFAHPSHRGIVFAVRIVEEPHYTLSAHRNARSAAQSSDRESIALGSFDGADRLAAWAAHVGANFDLLHMPTTQDWITGLRYWTTPGGVEFGARMPTYAPDADALRASVIGRLTRALVDFVAGNASTNAPWASFDLGELGSIVLERVQDPAWEPHVHARRLPERGDTTWRLPLPTYLLSPAAQIAIVDQVLAEHAKIAASPAGWPLEWRATTGSTMTTPTKGSLVLYVDRVEPERLTMGFLPARPRTLGESAATLVFRGENLLIVTADGARVSFRFPVPADVDATSPIFVSGWWTARSGDRFASILRLGARTFHFDNDGKLLPGR